jgi:metal-responsive CopG/Arc/MetJ family transcriptional regulator
MGEKSKTRVVLSLPEDLCKKLETHCRSTGKTENEVINQLLRDYLRKPKEGGV